MRAKPKKKHATVKTSDAKRIKYARLHLRDCPNPRGCSGCSTARKVFAMYDMEVPRRPDDYDGWYW